MRRTVARSGTERGGCSVGDSEMQRRDSEMERSGRGDQRRPNAAGGQGFCGFKLGGLCFYETALVIVLLKKICAEK